MNGEGLGIRCLVLELRIAISAPGMLRTGVLTPFLAPGSAPQVPCFSSASIYILCWDVPTFLAFHLSITPALLALGSHTLDSNSVSVNEDICNHL